MADVKVKETEVKLTPSRRTISKAELEEQVAQGVLQIQPIHGVDVIPNEIESTPPKPMEARPEELWVDRRYQRGHLSRKSQRLIHDIVSAWDWTKFKAPVVARDDQGRLLVIDGQHTAVAAASHPDIVKIPVMLVSLKDMEDQARAFIGHNTDRVNVPALDLYHARIAAKDELYVTADRVLKDNGISVVRSVAGSAAGETWTKNQTVATKVLVKLLDKFGEPKFNQIAEFVSQCGFSQIRADHWRFAAMFLTAEGERASIFSHKMMLEMIRQQDELDAFAEARKMATSLGRPTAHGLLLYYQLRYKEYYKIK